MRCTAVLVSVKAHESNLAVCQALEVPSLHTFGLLALGLKCVLLSVFSLSFVAARGKRRFAPWKPWVMGLGPGGRGGAPSPPLGLLVRKVMIFDLGGVR